MQLITWVVVDVFIAHSRPVDSLAIVQYITLIRDYVSLVDAYL